MIIVELRLVEADVNRIVRELRSRDAQGGTWHQRAETERAHELADRVERALVEALVRREATVSTPVEKL